MPRISEIKEDGGDPALAGYSRRSASCSATS